jgi:hypothetical protein
MKSNIQKIELLSLNISFNENFLAAPFEKEKHEGAHGSPTKILCAFLISHLCATYPVYLIFIGLIAIIIYGEEYTF